jgi:NTE family protein
MTEAGYDLALVLSGGNALAAYQGGAYEALYEHQLEPDWIVAASAGAVNGALISGNAPQDRIARLRSLWNVTETQARLPASAWSGLEEARRTSAALSAMTCGHSKLFVPRNLFGPGWNPLGNDEPSSLYDLRPLENVLTELADFDRVNRGKPRLSVTAVDVVSGDEVVFDTRTHKLTPAHIRASAALLPAFSPVELEGRLLGDAGLSANLPLDVVLRDTSERPLLCVAIDLLSLDAPPPQRFGETIARAQDLAFASQSRRTMAAWQVIFDERQRRGTARTVILTYIAYRDQAREVSGKAFDYSATSAGERWRAGYTDMDAALSQLMGVYAAGASPGLTIFRLAASAPHVLEQVCWPIGPVPG